MFWSGLVTTQPTLAISCKASKKIAIVVVEVIFSRGAWVVVGGGFCFKPLSSSFGSSEWLCGVVCKFFVFNSNENFHFLIRKVGWWHNSVLLLFSEQGWGSGRVGGSTHFCHCSQKLKMNPFSIRLLIRLMLC